MKAAVKIARKLKTENKDEALKQLAVAYKAIDKAAKRGVIKRRRRQEEIKTGQIFDKVKINKLRGGGRGGGRRRPGFGVFLLLGQGGVV